MTKQFANLFFKQRYSARVQLTNFIAVFTVYLYAMKVRDARRRLATGCWQKTLTFFWQTWYLLTLFSHLRKRTPLSVRLQRFLW